MSNSNVTEKKEDGNGNHIVLFIYRLPKEKS